MTGNERRMDPELLRKASQSAKDGSRTPEPPSCLLCGHFQVCAVIRALAPLMGNWPDEQKPFEAHAVASVCGCYAEQFISIRSKEEHSKA